MSPIDEYSRIKSEAEAEYRRTAENARAECRQIKKAAWLKYRRDCEAARVGLNLSREVVRDIPRPTGN